MFNALLLITALTVSGVAAWYSITGLAMIFAGAGVAVIIMGTALEVGKLVSVSYLKRYWTETSFLLKTYLITAIAVLMFITSMGIFGFLSNAHIQQTQSFGDAAIKVERLESQIAREQRAIEDADTILDQLDAAVNTLVEYDKISGDDGAIAVRESQSQERERLAAIINRSEDKIDGLRAEISEYKKEKNKLEAEVGPIKYIASLFKDDVDKDFMEDAVRWVIVTIIFVFDPLAICLLIAWNETQKNKINRSKVFVEDEGESHVEVSVDENESRDASVEVPERPVGKRRTNSEKKTERKRRKAELVSEIKENINNNFIRKN